MQVCTMIGQLYTTFLADTRAGVRRPNVLESNQCAHYVLDFASNVSMPKSDVDIFSRRVPQDQAYHLHPHIPW